MQHLRSTFIRPLGRSLALFGLSLAVNAAPQLTIVDLHHRPADQLIPILSPLMEAGDYLTGQNSKLLIRTDPATLSTITKIVAELDQPLTNLRISVIFGDHTSTATSALDADIIFNQSHIEPAKLSADAQSGDNLRAKISSRTFDTADRDHHQQTLQVLEGHEAIFNSQQQKPLVAIHYPLGHQPVPSVQHQTASSGFSVIARLQNNSVSLRIQPQKERFSNDGRLQSQRISTNLTVPLGQWVEIGSNLFTATDNSQSGLSRTKSRQDQQTSIKIRVDTVAQPN